MSVLTETTPEVWAIRSSLGGILAVRVDRETEKTIWYLVPSFAEIWRGQRSDFLPFRGSRDEAVRIANALKSARGEYDRRLRSADDWHKKRKAEILAGAGK